MQSKLPKYYEEDTVSQIQQRWDTDMGLCFSMCTNATKQDYQSALNIVSKERVLHEDEDDDQDPDRCMWRRWTLKHGTPMATFVSKNVTWGRAKEVAEECGLTPVDGGRAITTNLRKCITSRVEHITERGFEEPPRAIRLLTGPDACGWNQNPQNEEAKHLTSWVVSPNLARPLPNRPLRCQYSIHNRLITRYSNPASICACI